MNRGPSPNSAGWGCHPTGLSVTVQDVHHRAFLVPGRDLWDESRPCRGPVAMVAIRVLRLISLEQLDRKLGQRSVIKGKAAKTQEQSRGKKNEA